MPARKRELEVTAADFLPARRDLKSLREAAGFTQEELATIAGLSVHAVSALERGERRRPHVETVRALPGATTGADLIESRLRNGAAVPGPPSARP